MLYKQIRCFTADPETSQSLTKISAALLYSPQNTSNTMFKRFFAVIKARFVKATSPPKPMGPKPKTKDSIGEFEAPNSGRLNVLDNPKSNTADEKINDDQKWKDIYDKNK
jgi:hypothetical protein